METTSFSQKFLEISYQIKDNGFQLDIFGNSNYQAIYPPEVFQRFSLKNKRIIAENYIYCRTRALGLKTQKVLSYQFSQPFFASFVDYGIVGDLPRVSFVNNLVSKKIVDDFKKQKVFFQEKELSGRVLTFPKTSQKNVILAISFGKDSLLTYGIAKELGLNCHLVYVKEMENNYAVEEAHKKRIIKKFIRDEGVRIDYITDTVDGIFFNPKAGHGLKGFDNTNGMLAFTLELLPFAHYYRAGYLLYGNEANFSDFFSHYELKAYPSFDQTAIYTQRENNYLARLTNKSIQVVSLVEPFYNLMEMRILVSRYPDLLAYLMSCSPEKKGSDKWCYDCPMCAKSFLYLKAVGGKPIQIGFKKDFFSKQYLNFYPLFSKKIKRFYEMPKAVRDEELLGYLLAYRRGAKGDLIDLFKKDYLQEAEKREFELKKKFLGFHSTATIPPQLKNRVLDICQEELKKFYE